MAKCFLDTLRGVKTVQEAEQHGLRSRFAGLELESCERRLLAHGESVNLTPKVFGTLSGGIRHPNFQPIQKRGFRVLAPESRRELRNDDEKTLPGRH